MDWGLLVGVLGVPASVALTMAATSRGEFHFIRGCFIAVAVGTIGAHLWWQWTNDVPLTGWRVAIAGFVGAVTVAGLVVALEWVKRKEISALPEKTGNLSAVGELLLECQRMNLPTYGLPKQASLLMVEPFRFDKDGSIGFQTLPTEPGDPIKWPEEWRDKRASSARCRLTNYGTAPLFNVEIPIQIAFWKLRRGDNPGSYSANEVINVASATIPITKIEPGGDGAYIFYIHNQGRDVVHSEFPDAATCIPSGTTTRRPITLIQSTSVLDRHYDLWPIRTPEEIIAEEEKANQNPPVENGAQKPTHPQ